MASQLITVWKAVKQYEEYKANQEGYTVRVFPLLVSNANGMTDTARQIAKGEKVDILRAILPEKWYQHTDWEIERCEKLRR